MALAIIILGKYCGGLVVKFIRRMFLTVAFIVIVAVVVGNYLSGEGHTIPKVHTNKKVVALT